MSSKPSTPSFSEKRNRQKADKLVRTAENALATGRVSDAQKAANQTLSLIAGYPTAEFVLGQVARATGKLPDAARHFQNACNSPDAKVEYFHEFAGILGAMGKFDLVQQILFAALRRFPTHGPTYNELGVVLVKREFVTQGIEILEKGIAFNKDDWSSLYNLGSALVKVGRDKEAIPYLDRASELARNNPERLERTLLLTGEAHRHLGDMEAARTCFRSVLKANPACGQAWQDLSDITKFTADSDDIKTMVALLNRDDPPLEKFDRETIGFALGKAFMDCGDAKQAIAHLDQANALRRSDFAGQDENQQGYDSKIACARVRAIADYFPASLFENLPEAGKDDPTYAFIVGMPRSGSTLTEQILGSHPDTLPTGELRSFPKFKDRLFGQLFPSTPGDHEKIASGDLLGELATLYRNELAEMFAPSADTRVIIDKMLGNFSWAGLILLAIPGAKIIHCRRNPVDTCLSCYSKRFANLQVYTCDQTELGEFYRAYDDLMAHWRKVLPADRFIEVNYEDVVSDIEQQSHRLIEFLGLPWDDAVLDFQKASRSVRTASAAQVRQKLYQTSVERWKPYEPYIQPLLSALGLHESDRENS